MAVPHLLLVSAVTGYQAERFRQAAEHLGVRLTLATDRCDQLPDPWGDQAVPVRFNDPKAALAALTPLGPFQGVVVCGDRGAVLGAHIAAGLGLAFHSVRSAEICHDKYAFKQAMTDAGLPVPWFKRVRHDASAADLAALAAQIAYPCVLKPLMLSGSRGVIRANDAAEFTAAFARIRSLLLSPALQQQKDPNSQWIQLEGYIAGAEFALEGWMKTGVLQRFALFDKPDALEGPFFEETLYVTPSRLDTDRRAAIWDMVEAAARAVGLGPGPLHAEIRWSGETAYVLELAARPIGGLCARSMRFRPAGQPGAASSPELISLEELLARGALGESLRTWEREPQPAGVMMIPIPRGGILAEVRGVEAARAVPGVEAVEITAKPDLPLEPLPEGSTYLGFIFARGKTAEQVEESLRAAHRHLEVKMRDTLPVL